MSSVALNSVDSSLLIADNQLIKESALDVFLERALAYHSSFEVQALVELYLSLCDEDKVDALYLILEEGGESCEELFIHLFSHSQNEVQNQWVAIDEDEQYTWAHIAALFGKQHVMRHLLDCGFNMHTVSTYAGATPLSIALAGDIASNRPLLDMLKKVDDMFTDRVAELKVWGSRFSLSGPLFESAPLTLVAPFFESLSRTLCIAENSVEDPVRGEIISKIVSIVWTVLDKTPEQQRAGLCSSSWVMLDTGYDNHATIHLISSAVCVEVDTGIKDGGFEIYRIGTPDLGVLRATMGVLSLLNEKLVSRNLARDYWSYTKKNLQLKSVCKFSSPQTVGNCAWQRLAVAVMALFVLIHCQQPGGDKHSKQALISYNEWENVDCQEAFEYLMINLSKVPDAIYNRENIVNGLMFDALRRAFLGNDKFLSSLLTLQHVYADVIKMDLTHWQDPHSGASLARFALHYEMPNVFAALVSLNANFELPDGQGKTIFDDVREGRVVTGKLYLPLQELYKKVHSLEKKAEIQNLCNRLRLRV
jgi:hypothetical protein